MAIVCGNELCVPLLPPLALSEELPSKEVAEPGSSAGYLQNLISQEAKAMEKTTEVSVLQEEKR